MSDEDAPTNIQSIAVSGVTNAALIAALISKLAEKGVLSDSDTHDIYDDALHRLEQQQALAGPDAADLFRMTRQVIEGPLRDS